MSKGVIYVLTNPSFPEYVKIGYADNLERRLKEFNNSSCLPFAFRVHCVYEVDDRLTDKKLHSMIDKLNPDLRAIETFDGKPRVREFYNMSADDAYELLSCIASISGTFGKLRKVTPTGHEVKDEKLAKDLQESGIVKYTEDDHILHGNKQIVELYEKLRSQILSLGKIHIEPKKLYIAFKKETNICDVEIQKSKLKITINLPKGRLIDPKHIARDVSSSGHWGNGDYIVNLNDEDMLSYVMDLIKQSYDAQ